MFCVGSAVRNHEGQAICSISVASIYSLINEVKKEMIAEKVKEVALEISRKLGFKGDRIYSE